MGQQDTLQQTARFAIGTRSTGMAIRMMKNKSSRRLIVVTGGLVLGICLIAAGIDIVFDPFIEQVAFYPSSLGTFRATGSFKINPATILAALDNGGSSVFVTQPLPDEPRVSEGHFLWNQSDYLKIATNAFQFQWKEIPTGWDVFGMIFDSNCQDNPSGFYDATIIYFKSVWVRQTLEYTARQIEIHPLWSEVDWGGETNFPHPILGWGSIDLNHLNISADDALKIAEENGGKVARMAIQNNCQILLVLHGDSSIWNVYYERNTDGLDTFKISINPYTGEIYTDRYR
jgi:hypothetical protein